MSKQHKPKRGRDRKAVKQLMTARGYIDVLIPRGGADLIRTEFRHGRETFSHARPHTFVLSSVA
jgi:hypothetical protein